MKRTRRSFLVGILTFGAGFSGWKWLWSRESADGIPWPVRAVLDANGRLWHALFRADGHGEAPAVAAGKRPRVNGNVGLSDDGEEYRVEVEGRSLELSELRALPRTDIRCMFRCIEGWSEAMSFSGVRFRDLLSHLKLPTDRPYVGLETPDGDYYVSLDIESMLHPDTLLAFEMNGAPLRPANGAPIRLIVPVKYGIKSLKRVGKITLATERPPDYWHERGYDWYAGL